MPRLYFFLLLDRLSYVAFKSTTTNGYFLILEQAILVAVVPRLTSCWSLFVYACGRNVINLPSYPPTPNHLVVLLSAFRTHEASDPVPLDSKATLDSVPSLLVLHELSAYFLPMNENKPYVLFALAVCITFLGNPAVVKAHYRLVSPACELRAGIVKFSLPGITVRRMAVKYPSINRAFNGI